MRQLSALDAGFLYSDTSQANANVTLIQIYDQSTAPGGKVRFKSIMAHIESRLSGLPLFRSKLQRVPLDLDHPYWVDDPNFDLEYHVRHIALPKPGDWRQFCIQASRIHARPLDLNRPLWEIYVVEGLDSLLELPAGSFALLTKVHHAAVDAAGGSRIAMMLNDITPSVTAPAPAPPWFPAARSRQRHAAVSQLAERRHLADGTAHAAGAKGRRQPARGLCLRQRPAVAAPATDAHALQLGGVGAPRLRHASFHGRGIRCHTRPGPWRHAQRCGAGGVRRRAAQPSAGAGRTARQQPQRDHAGDQERQGRAGRRRAATVIGCACNWAPTSKTRCNASQRCVRRRLPASVPPTRPLPWPMASTWPPLRWR